MSSCAPTRARERDEIIVRLTGTAQRLSQMATAHAGELTQLRAGAVREPEELRAALESRAQVLEESRGELRGRAGRDLDAARAGLTRIRQEPGTAETEGAPRHRRSARSPE